MLILTARPLSVSLVTCLSRSLMLLLSEIGSWINEFYMPSFNKSTFIPCIMSVNFICGGKLVVKSSLKKNNVKGDHNYFYLGEEHKSL